MNLAPSTEYTVPQGRPTNRQLNQTHQGSIKMYSMHEALARDRMREQEQRSREARLARSLAARSSRMSCA